MRIAEKKAPPLKTRVTRRLNASSTINTQRKTTTTEAVGTKTAVQIRSHAQKFFSKLEKKKEAGEATTAGELLFFVCVDDV